MFPSLEQAWSAATGGSPTPVEAQAEVAACSRSGRRSHLTRGREREAARWRWEGWAKAKEAEVALGAAPPWVCPTCHRAFPLWGELALHREATEHRRGAIVRRRSTCTTFHGEYVAGVHSRVMATLKKAEAGFAHKATQL